MISGIDAIDILERAREHSLTLSFENGGSIDVISISVLASILAQMGDGVVGRKPEESMLQDSLIAQGAGVDPEYSLSQKMWLKQYTAPNPSLDCRPWPLGTVETH